MLIHCLFVKSDGEMIEMLEAVTDYDYSDYPDYFDDAIRKAHANTGYDQVKVIDIEVEYSSLDALFENNPSVSSKKVTLSKVGNDGNS